MNEFGYFKCLLFAVLVLISIYNIVISFGDFPEGLGSFTIFGSSPLTIHCNKGRLGNQMSTYATLYGISRRNNRTPVGQWCNMNHLMPYFQLTTAVVPDVDKTRVREYKLAPYLRKSDSNLPSRVNILTGYAYPRSYTFYHQFKDEILREFTFKPPIMRYARVILKSLRGRRTPTPKVFVGMHVRRGDFCNVLEKYHGRSFDKQYLLKAMDYFRQKYEGVLFVVVSDDRKWCKKNLGKIPDVDIAPEPPDAAHDLAILTHCNHTIITYGSYGYWGAYLAGGETVYFTDFLAPYSPLKHRRPKKVPPMPPGWIGISTTPKEYWETHEPTRCSDVL